MTGRDLVSASLRLIGALAPGETLAAQEATDGLAAFNRMIASLSNEGLLIYAITAEAPLTLTPGSATVTMGVAGSITTRPQAIEKAVIRDGTLDFPPMRLLSIDEYAAIPLKSLQSTYPTDLYDDGGYPLRTLSLYPVPSAAKQLILFTTRALTQITTLDTVLDMPPGYEEMLIYNFAPRIAPEYGKQTPAEVVQIATSSMAAIKRANHKPRYLRADHIPAGTHKRFNILTGDYR